MAAALRGAHQWRVPQPCWTCFAPRPQQMCSKCRTAYFCDTECQRAGWPRHRHVCGGPDSRTPPSLVHQVTQVSSGQVQVSYDVKQRRRELVATERLAEGDIVMSVPANAYARRTLYGPSGSRGALGTFDDYPVQCLGHEADDVLPGRPGRPWRPGRPLPEDLFASCVRAHMRRLQPENLARARAQCGACGRGDCGPCRGADLPCSGWRTDAEDGAEDDTGDRVGVFALPLALVSHSCSPTTVMRVRPMHGHPHWPRGDNRLDLMSPHTTRYAYADAAVFAEARAAGAARVVVELVAVVPLKPGERVTVSFSGSADPRVCAPALARYKVPCTCDALAPLRSSGCAPLDSLWDAMALTKLSCSATMVADASAMGAEDRARFVTGQVEQVMARAPKVRAADPAQFQAALLVALKPFEDIVVATWAKLRGGTKGVIT